MSSYIAKCAMTLLIAMTPILELRGAIPYGLARDLPFALVFGLSLLGNIIPVPFIILFIRRVFQFLRKNPRLGSTIDRLERKAHIKGRIMNKYKTLGLFVLVAIPLPGTGAWTGALVAGILDIRLRNALPAICLGVLAAGLIVTFVSYSAIWTFT